MYDSSNANVGILIFDENGEVLFNEKEIESLRKKIHENTATIEDIEKYDFLIKIKKKYDKYKSRNHLCNDCEYFFYCDKVLDPATNGFKKYDEYEVGITNGFQTIGYDKDRNEYYDRLRIIGCKSYTIEKVNKRRKL